MSAYGAMVPPAGNCWSTSSTDFPPREKEGVEGAGAAASAPFVCSGLNFQRNFHRWLVRVGRKRAACTLRFILAARRAPHARPASMQSNRRMFPVNRINSAALSPSRGSAAIRGRAALLLGGARGGEKGLRN